MANKMVAEVESVLSPIATELGLELVEVEYAKKIDGMHMTVFVDKAEGVSLEDCEKFHHAIDEPLDLLDPTNGMQYTLNVSSMGLDRPLKTNRDFEKKINTEIIVKFFAPYEGKKIWEGVLKSFDEQSFVIVCKKDELVVDRSKVALVQPVIKF